MFRVPRSSCPPRHQDNFCGRGYTRFGFIIRTWSSGLRDTAQSEPATSPQSESFPRENLVSFGLIMFKCSPEVRRLGCGPH